MAVNQPIKIVSTAPSVSSNQPYCAYGSGRTIMSHPVIHQVLERVAARTAREVTLERGGHHEIAPYLVRCGDRHAYVDRVLANKLREQGGRWLGDVATDPCAVA
jgi:hypothetical protein